MKTYFARLQEGYNATEEGQLELAYQSFAQAFIVSERHEARILMGSMLVRLERHSEAIEIFDALLNGSQPLSAEARAAVERLHHEVGKPLQNVHLPYMCAAG